MSTYKRILIQKQVPSAEVKDTAADFGWWVMDAPFHVGGEMKELPSNDWPDEDGLEVFVPPTGQYSKSYDIEMKFAFRYDAGSADWSSHGRAKAALNAFRNYLSGRDGSGVMMKVYSEHGDSGRQGVYLLEISDNPTYYCKEQGRERAFIVVKMRVTDPLTDITLSL